MTGRASGGTVALPSGTATAAAGSGTALALRLWHGLPGLLSANAAFLVWCAPFGCLALLGLPTLALAVVPLTAGPGLVALVAAAARVSRSEPARAWSANLRDIRAGFGAGAVLSAGFLLAWHAQILALRSLVADGGTPPAVVAWGGQLAVLAAGALIGVQALALAGRYGQGLPAAVRNGFVLAVRHPGPAVAMVAATASGAAVTWSLAGAPLVIAPAVLAFLLVTVTERVVEGQGDTA